MKNKKVMALVGALAIAVVGVSIFVFAPKDSGSAEVAQEVVEAVETPSIEIPEEVVEEPEVVEEVEEVPEVEVQETSEEVSPVVEETSEEVSIVEVAETTEEVTEEKGVSTQKEEVSSEQVAEPKQEEVKPAETKPVETQPQQTKTEPNVNQISTDEASKALIAQLTADGAIWGDTPATSTLGECPSSGGAAAQIIVE